MVQQKSLYYANANLNEYLNEMSQLLCAGRIKRNVRTMTKNGEYGGVAYTIVLNDFIFTSPAPTSPPSLPPPNDPPVPEYPPGSYPPGYVPPTPPPYTGGGGGGGNQQPSSPPILSSPNADYDEIKNRINEILPYIWEKLKEMGIDLNDYKLEIAVHCASNVRVVEDGTIGICASFVNKGYTLDDQVSIIWHEIYHVNNDSDYSTSSQQLSFDIVYPDIPVDIENYIRNDLYGDRISDQEYQQEIKNSSILAPEYYKNEIAAYQAEMKNDLTVSTAYAMERKYVYWKHQQDLKIAEKYYNK